MCQKIRDAFVGSFCGRTLTAHVFDGISPSCSNVILNKIAAYNVKKYEEASSILRQNFYVDDMLRSFPNAKIAVDMSHKVKSLYKEGGFNFTKFSSNHVKVLKSIPDKCIRVKDEVKNKGLNLGILLPEDKALGVKWKMPEDTFGIIKLDETLAS